VATLIIKSNAALQAYATVSPWLVICAVKSPALKRLAEAKSNFKTSSKIILWIDAAIFEAKTVFNSELPTELIDRKIWQIAIEKITATKVVDKDQPLNNRDIIPSLTKITAECRLDRISNAIAKRPKVNPSSIAEIPPRNATNPNKYNCGHAARATNL